METQLKSSLIYFLDTVSADIETLEDIAVKVAKEEADMVKRNTGWDSHTTTFPNGQSPGPKCVGTKSRCTIPLAMLCFSTMDFLGALLKQKLSRGANGMSNAAAKNQYRENSKPKDEFILHAQLFISQLSKKSDVIRPKNEKILQEAYRNSIAHSFLPSSSSAFGFYVSHSDTLDDYTLLQNVEYKNEYNIAGVMLNVKCLTKLVKDGIETFRLLIESNEAEAIFSKYEQIIKANHTRLSNI